MTNEKRLLRSRTAKWFGGMVAAGIGLMLVAGTASAVDTWSINCTPDIIQIFPDRVVSRCQQNGFWYTINYAGKTDAYIDRLVRALEAAQLSGKTVQFRDVGGQVSDAVALYR